MDLTKLTLLPGAEDENFEAFTRTIVSRRYGALGKLRERRQQPGVEFYLQVEHAGPLGHPGRLWGWSCKWFLLGPKNELTIRQREQIEDSFKKAIEFVVGLTDFVLCLPLRPAKKDEEWIDGLGRSRGISTKLWAGENFDAELAGLDDLRSTFFGELVLSPAVLAQAHERSVAPVRARWLPPLHASNHAERRLERALLRPGLFDGLDKHVAAVAARIATLRAALGDIEEEDTRAGAENIADDLDRFLVGVRAIVEAGRSRRPMEVRERLGNQPQPVTSPRKLRTLVLALRKRRLPAALAVGGLAAEVRDVVRWMQDTYAETQAPLIAVVAAAGLGKTHLAAQLTAPTDRPTAGVFIQGGRLPAGGSLDGLVQRIPGLQVRRFEDLLEALNSAGVRAGSRVPLVIDGLNEAERPSGWRALLDEIIPALGDYPHVVLVITLREALASRAIPDKATTIHLEWSKAEVDDIVGAYFKHFLINDAGAWVPRGLFHSPLFVRMYCEAANPLRQHPVSVEALPTSLVGVFELYRERVTNRLADDPARVPVPADQIRRRLGRLALEMWTRGVRRLPSDDARAILDDGEKNWDESLFRRLEEEGVLFREEVDGSDDTETGVLFDRFAGYLIADACLVRMAYAEVDQRLAESSLWESLLGEVGHPFGEDVAVCLTGLVPRRFNGRHLWRCAPNAHRSWAIAQELDSESQFLDDGTIDAIANLIISWNCDGSPSRDCGLRHAFDRLWEVRSSHAHRLNAEFLDRVMRLLPLPERDRRWTEWGRYSAGDPLVSSVQVGHELLCDLEERIAHWTKDLNRGQSDDLDALAIAWLLTSTCEDVRDLATKALQRYGRPDPKRLFSIAARLLDVDDPYVVERVVGAAFGAACSHQMPDPGGSFERALHAWLVELGNRFLCGGSTPTAHELLRSYVRATFELAGKLHSRAVPDGVDALALKFASPLPVHVMADDDSNAEECLQTLGMDFQNYVIGAAIAGRRNYDFNHTGFRKARSEVMARVWALGWRAALFADVDRQIAQSNMRHGRQPAKTERYGKKYGWIAYYELIGRLADAGQIRESWVGGDRNATPDIDPSFPDEPSLAPLSLPEWAPAGKVDDKKWFRAGGVHVPEELWAPAKLYGVAADWLLVEGFLEHRREGRSVWGFFRTLLVEPSDVDSACKVIDGVANLGDDVIPRIPTIRDVFAGEMPWSHRFDVRSGDDPDDSLSALRCDWLDKGILVGQVAVEIAVCGSGSPAALRSSYHVPSFEFASRFGLRQMPGTLDLVGLDGAPASASFSTADPWRGHLLFIRRDLVVDFAGVRRIVQMAWGARELGVERYALPSWARDSQVEFENTWRNTRVL